jgi:hypothetical protein
MAHQPEQNGEIHTITLLERLRNDARTLWDSTYGFYWKVDELLRQVANPNLHDIPLNLQFRVEMWDRLNQHIRFVVRREQHRCPGASCL